MNTGKHLSLLILCLFVAACVTVNVYFPAAAAEKAVDRFVKDVYGEEATSETTPEDEGQANPSSGLMRDMTNPVQGLAIMFADLIIPQAQAAQPNIDISTPAINKLKSAMTSRHGQLQPFYQSGAVGMTSNALLVVRDDKAVSIKERNRVKQLVAEENRDRNQLYKEIGVANGHPEWEGQIRNLFAQRWIANAPSGWWFQDGGWKQK